jgi:hypothetical protein
MSANGPEPQCEVCDARASETPLSREGDHWLCNQHASMQQRLPGDLR